jgi:glycosyltransferase involved in cell wall biosynthesis
MKKPVLYVFGGEEAQGAEVVIERLMFQNLDNVEPHLFISPGRFADELVRSEKPYEITILPHLKKLNRSSSSVVKYYLLAIRNYIMVSYLTGKYVKKHKINTVHANTVVPASYLLLLIIWAKLFSPRMKWLWSDHDIKYYSRLDHLLSGWCVGLYNFTLVVSEAVKHKYKSSSKVVVLYNGLNPVVFKPDSSERDFFRRKLQIPDNDIVIGMPAVVHPRKGQLGLIEVFNKLVLKYPGIQLLFAGGYESATPDYSRSVIEAIEAHNKIRHIGYVTSMTEFYNGCDIIINNSDLSGSEPLGTTIYEAMACEKIVVASVTGGTPEIVSDEIDGYLFEAENKTALEETLDFIIGRYDSLALIKKTARDKVKRKFSLVGMASRYNRITECDNYSVLQTYNT